MHFAASPLEKPIVELLIGIGLRPRVMTRLRVDREEHLAPAFFQRVHHPFRALNRHDDISGSMEGPDWYMLDATHCIGIASSADGSDSGKTLGISDCHSPRPESPHTQPCQIDALRIDAILAHGLGKHCCKRIGVPATPAYTLGRQDNEWEIRLILQELWQSLACYECRIIAAFTCPMEKKDERPALFRLCIIRSGQVE